MSATTLAPPRRLVTAVNAAGESVITADSTVPMLEIPGTPYLRGNNFVIQSFPADNQTSEDTGLTSLPSIVTPNGAAFYYLDIAPASTGMMHFTQSTDLGIMISGELELELPGEVKTVFKAGDAIVQRGNLHAWNNKSQTEWARLLVVVIQAKKIVGSDGKGLEGAEFP